MKNNYTVTLTSCSPLIAAPTNISSINICLTDEEYMLLLKIGALLQKESIGNILAPIFIVEEYKEKYIE